jgi:hypothetical protein
MEFEVYNPHGKPIEELPFIYGFNNGGSRGWYHACLISQDGEGLGDHLCSDESFMYGDLGLLKGSRSDRHATFREHYPDGYRMDFVSEKVGLSHEGFAAALKANQVKYAAELAAESAQ